MTKQCHIEAATAAMPSHANAIDCTEQFIDCESERVLDMLDAVYQDHDIVVNVLADALAKHFSRCIHDLDPIDETDRFLEFIGDRVSYRLIETVPGLYDVFEEVDGTIPDLLPDDGEDLEDLDLDYDRDVLVDVADLSFDILMDDLDMGDGSPRDPDASFADLVHDLILDHLSANPGHRLTVSIKSVPDDRDGSDDLYGSDNLEDLEILEVTEGLPRDNDCDPNLCGGVCDGCPFADGVSIPYMEDGVVHFRNYGGARHGQ